MKWQILRFAGNLHTFKRALFEKIFAIRCIFGTTIQNYLSVWQKGGGWVFFLRKISIETSKVYSNWWSLHWAKLFSWEISLYLHTKEYVASVNFLYFKLWTHFERNKTLSNVYQTICTQRSLPAEMNHRVLSSSPSAATTRVPSPAPSWPSHHSSLVAISAILISNLDDDSTTNIFRFLSPFDVLNAERVNKR